MPRHPQGSKQNLIQARDAASHAGPTSLSNEAREYLAFIKGAGKRFRRGPFRGNRWFYVQTSEQHEVFPNAYASLRKECEDAGCLEIDHGFTKPTTDDAHDGDCMAMRITKKGRRVKGVRSGRMLQRLCDRLSKKRRSPKEDDVARKWVTCICADGTKLRIPCKRVRGVWYPMLSISNFELNETTGRLLRYLDVKGAFTTALTRLLGRVGFLNEGLKQFLLNVPRGLKQRTLTAINRVRSAQDDQDERIREVAQAAKALRRHHGWSKADLYWALCAEVVVPFQDVLFELGAMCMPRLDGAFVPDWVSLNEVNRRLKALAGDEFEVREKQL